MKRLSCRIEKTVNQSIFVFHFLTDVQNREKPATTNPQSFDFESMRRLIGTKEIKGDVTRADF